MTASVESLEEAVEAATSESGRQWLHDARTAVAADPTAIRRLFPAAGRRVGRGTLGTLGTLGTPRTTPAGLDPHAWTVADGARVLLLAAGGPAALGAGELEDLYFFGDSDERRAILRALGVLGVDDGGMVLVRDAIRTNDGRLLAAALSPAAMARLSDRSLAQAVLKCVFSGVPLAGIEGLRERSSPEMSRMLAGYVHERIAAGRAMPGELWAFIDAHPPAGELAAIEAELEHPVEDRRRAAAAALSLRSSPPAAHAKTQTRPAREE
jgi:hypothetical protein